MCCLVGEWRVNSEVCCRVGEWRVNSEMCCLVGEWRVNSEVCCRVCKWWVNSEMCCRVGEWRVYSEMCCRVGEWRVNSALCCLVVGRSKLLQTTRGRMEKDGLSTTKYHVTSLLLKPLYTWITVSVNESEILSVSVCILVIHLLSSSPSELASPCPSTKRESCLWVSVFCSFSFCHRHHQNKHYRLCQRKWNLVCECLYSSQSASVSVIIKISITVFVNESDILSVSVCILFIQLLLSATSELAEPSPTTKLESCLWESVF